MSDNFEVEALNVRHALAFAVRKVMSAERALLDQRASERALMFHLGRYLIDCVELPPNLSVDLEYNRATAVGPIKRVLADAVYDQELRRQRKRRSLSTSGVQVLPDLIIHDRHSRAQNFLAIEVKVDATNAAARLDVAKLASIRSQLRYEHAVFIDIRRGGTARWYWVTSECIDSLQRASWTVPLVPVDQTSCRLRGT